MIEKMTNSTKKARAEFDADIEEAIWLRLENQHQKSQDELRTMSAHWSEACLKKYGPDQFSLAERGWAAGFWDGEGHASLSARRDGSFSCSVDQNDRVSLERFQRIVDGVGKITGPRRRTTPKGKRQLIYRWNVTNQSDLKKVWNAIGEFLGTPKRNQFARVLGSPTATMISKEKLPVGAVAAEVQKPVKSRT